MLTNTMSRKKEEFKPIESGKVGMYVCGPTVYDRAHIGNARSVVFFDVLYRLLKQLYPVVCYVRNITDVDDKINAKFKKTGESISSITKRTTAMFHEDMSALNVLFPDEEPRATEHIDDMIALVERLLENGNAYEAEGHVLFDVSSMPEYGRLSRRSQDEMLAGARVEVASYKRDSADFVLWKPSEDDLPGWESPWGRGRPGWHLECSAMSLRYLGKIFDIHGGGQDLIFPHHENEIAQSCCGNDTETYANYWVHNGHLIVNGEKMSKSLGNFFTVKEVLEKAQGEAIRFCLISTHYRQPLNWTDKALEQAKSAMDRFYTALRNVENIEAEKVEIPQKIMEALKDDVNTPLAISHMHEIVSELNKCENDEQKALRKGELLAAGGLLGLFKENPEEWFHKKVLVSHRGNTFTSYDDNITRNVEIDNLIAGRTTARKAKNFARADEIRDELKALNVVLEDTPSGTIWKYGK